MGGACVCVWVCVVCVCMCTKESKIPIEKKNPYFFLISKAYERRLCSGGSRESLIGSRILYINEMVESPTPEALDTSGSEEK